MVYAELIFIDNFAIDTLLLALSLHISHFRVCLWRLLLGGVIGGMYAVAAAMLGGALLWIPVKVVIGAAMCAVNGIKPFRKFALATAVFFGASLVAAGAAMLISESDGKTIRFDSPAIRYVSIGLFAALLVWEIISRVDYPKKDEIYKVELAFGDRRAELTAMLDTGNGIKDISGRSVIVADRAALEAQIGDIGDFDVCFSANTAAGKCALKARMPDELYLYKETVKYSSKAYICIADNMVRGEVNAVLGSNMHMRKV